MKFSTCMVLAAAGVVLVAGHALAAETPEQFTLTDVFGRTKGDVISGKASGTPAFNCGCSCLCIGPMCDVLIEHSQCGGAAFGIEDGDSCKKLETLSMMPHLGKLEQCSGTYKNDPAAVRLAESLLEALPANLLQTLAETIAEPTADATPKEQPRKLSALRGSATGRKLSNEPECQPGRELQTGLCYTPCREGFVGVGPVCWGSCPDGWTDAGALCTDWRVGSSTHLRTDPKASYGRGVGLIPPQVTKDVLKGLAKFGGIGLDVLDFASNFF